jgi:protein SCO1/2
MRFVIFAVLLVFACAVSATPPSGVAANVSIPKNSVYQLSDSFSDQNGKNFKLAARSGQVQLIAMFYSSCKYACPLIIDSAKAVEHALSPERRSKLAVLLISFDPARDTPAVLAALALERKLDLSRWTLARTESSGVRKVAALLGVRYRELANGEFNHSSQLIVLDAQGRFLGRTEKMGGVPEPEFMQVLEQALAGE